MNVVASLQEAHVGYVVYKPEARLGPRRQQDLQLVYVYEGCVDVWIDRKLLHIDADEIALLLPGNRVFFQFNRLGRTGVGWCAFREPRLDTSALAWLTAGPTVRPFDRRLRHLARAARAAYRAPGTRSHPYHLAQCHALLAAFCQAHPPPDTMDLPAPIRRAETFMRTHLGQPLTLSDVARAAAVSPPHLGRLYRQHLQTAPMRRLWALRVEEALWLLRETGLQVNVISARVGFQSPHHCARVIKEVTQLTPLEYRDRQWNA